MLTLPWAGLLLLTALLVPFSTQAARQLELTVERLDAGALRAEGLALQLAGAEAGADPSSLRIALQRIEMPALSLVLPAVAWRCDRVLRVDPFVCEGPLDVAGRPRGRLAVDLSTARTGMRWSQGRRAITLDKDVASPWRVAAQRLPVAWLEGFIAAMWSGGRVGAGEISGRLAIAAASPATRVEGELRFGGLAFDTPDGLMAGAGLEVPMRLRYASDAKGTRIRLEGAIDTGELLVSPVYLAVPDAGIPFQLELVSQAEGGWRLPHWRWEDAGALVAEGDAGIGPDGRITSVSARLRTPDLGNLRTRYLDGVLAPAGFGDLRLGGRAQGVVAFDDEGLSALEVHLQDALAIDPKGRFSLAGLGGDLRWSRDAVVADSRLGWQAAALYGIGVDAGALAFRSRDGQLQLLEPMRAASLGGHVRLDRFVWRPPRGERPLRIEMGLALEALDLGSLSQRLGWPDFEGTLGGTLPNALYEHNRVTFEGGLAMQLFGGEVRIADLALERPFGVAPSLAANLRFDGIDLAPLTGAFGFGEITGRLNGRLRGLRLVDWTPVAFDARLLSDRSYQGPRRISQRAVQDISDLGGSGLVAGLQARLLRTFDDFGYERIGIGCVLKDNRCTMSGLKKRGAGYIIIEGRGLPRIEVVGFRRDVDWPTLVARLKDATEGDTLRIE